MKNKINKFLITRGIYPSSWKRSFQSGGCYYYNGTRVTFKKSLPYLSGGRALDIGAGFGNETKELLRRGFEVVATDQNLEAVKYLKKLSRNKKLTVLNQSLPEFPEGKFDLIVCEMVLHFLEEKSVHSSIKNIQNATSSGGLNVISSYTESRSIRQDPRLEGYFSYLLKSDELNRLYKNWDILYSELKVNMMGHESIRFIARKK